MRPVERVIAAARAELGYLEKASNAQLDSRTANAGDKNYTKYARDLFNWTPWGYTTGRSTDTPGVTFSWTGA